MNYGARQLGQIHAIAERGDLAAAVAAIEAAVQREPSNAAAWHLAGVLRRRSGDHSGAVAALDRAAASGLNTAEVHNSRGLSLQQLGRMNEAIAAFDRALVIDPNYVPAAANKGRAIAENGATEEAIDWLESLRTRYPRSALVSNALATTFLEAGEAKAAADLYSAVLTGEPANAVATIRLGQALRQQGEPSAAAAHYAAAMQMNASPELMESWAGALVDAGLSGEARAVLENLVRAAPGYLSGHRALARLAREFDPATDAWQSYRRIARQWPQEASIWIDWMGQAVSFRDYEEAVAIARNARRHLPEMSQISLPEAVALSELGRVAEAEGIFEQLERENPDDSVLLNQRARNSLRRGEPAQAEAIATRATQVAPHDVFAWAYLALAWRLLDDPREFWLHDYELQVSQQTLPYLQEPSAMEELVQRLRAMHLALSHPPDQSLRNGTQTAGALFARQDRSISQLKAAILRSQAEYAAGLPHDRQHPFYSRNSRRVRVVGSWSVRLHGGGFHVPHLHQAGWISSALHLVVPPPAPEEEPNAGCLMLGAPPAELGLDLPPRRIVRPQPGALVLFPSSMWHGTLPFEGGSERLTVAFDSVPD